MLALMAGRNVKETMQVVNNGEVSKSSPFGAAHRQNLASSAVAKMHMGPLFFLWSAA